MKWLTGMANRGKTEMDTGRTLLCSAAPDSVDPWRQLKWHLTLLLAGRESESSRGNSTRRRQILKPQLTLVHSHLGINSLKRVCPAAIWPFLWGWREKGGAEWGMRINLPQFSGFFLCQMAASNGNGPANSISGGEIPKRLPKTARISAPLSAACWREMPKENSAKKFGKRQQKVGREICKLEQGCCSCCWVYNLI